MAAADPAALLARLADAGHATRLDPKKPGSLLVMGGASLPADLKAELLEAKPALVAHLQAEEIARLGTPFHTEGMTPVLLESYAMLPDGSLIPSSALQALRDLRAILGGGGRERALAEKRKAKAREKAKRRTSRADLIWTDRRGSDG